MIVYIQVAFLLICVCEAWLEAAVIKLKSEKVEDYTYWNKIEHTRSAIYSFIIFLSLVLFIIIFHNIRGYSLIIKILLFYPFLRRVGFDFPLKIFRNRKIHIIEGNQPIDVIAKKIYGINGGWKDVGVCIIILILINWWM